LNLLRKRIGLPACQVGKYRNLSISLNELNWNWEIEKSREGFNRHWTRKHVATDDDSIYLGRANLLKHGFECGEISMDVVDCRDSHDAFYTREYSPSS
jgi:hypothetical protein